MKKIIFLASVLSMLLLGNFANAQSRGDHKGNKVGKQQFHRKGNYKTNLAHRQHIQGQRIHQGVRNGQLTRNEAKHLRKQQFRINNYKKMAMADGRINKQERRMLNNAQKRANRNIAYMKHNKQIRYNRY